MPSLVLLILSVVVSILLFHEPWRDEAHALLIARDRSDLGSLIAQLRYDGHPPLLHLSLQLALAAGGPATALATVGGAGYALTLLGIYRFLLALGVARPSALRITLAAGLTYTCFYELGVVVRGYGIGLGLCLMGQAALWNSKADGPWKHAILASLYLSLAITSSVHAALLSGCALVSWTLTHRWNLRPIFLTMPALLFTAWIVSPFADRSSLLLPEAMRKGGMLDRFADSMITSVVTCGWWEVCLPERIQWTASLLIVGGLLSTAVFIARRNSQAPVIGAAYTYLLSFIGFSLFFSLVYEGSYRHHLFPIMQGLLVCIAAAYVDTRRALRVMSGTVACMWIAHQGAIMSASVALDLRFPFSSTKEIAAALPPGATLVTNIDYYTESVALWRSDVELVAPQSHGVPYTFVTWNDARDNPAPMDHIVKVACAEKTHNYVALAKRMQPPDECLQRISLEVPEYEANTGEYLLFAEYRCDCDAVWTER